jgi:predicted  nucleic acid-binding Zn-ribbon protein
VKIGSDIKAQEKKILSGISEEITDPQSVLEINRLRLHISILKSDCGKLRNELLIIANEKGKNSKEITELKNLLHKTATQLQAAHKKINKIKAKCDFASSIEKENVALKLVIEVNLDLMLGPKFAIRNAEVSILSGKSNLERERD